jgi:exosortase
MGTLVFAWLALCHKLRADWSVNDQYQYGWFVPPLALALLALRWGDRPPAAPDPGPPGWLLAWLAGGCLLLLWPVRLTEEPNPDWRLLFWLHGGLLCALSLAYLAWTGGWPWVRHFAFPVGFLLLAIPWPSGPEQAIVQSLMRVVAAISAEGMNLLGIPAQPRGNLIHIRGQTVGVDEACSGIRSLQTMLMAGLLLGELSRLRWGRRLALLGGGLVVAMVANVLRCSLLVWIAASYGTAAFDGWHDPAGVAVLLIVFAGLLWMNGRLARGNRPPAPPAAAPEDRPGRVSIVPAQPVPVSLLVAAAVWLLAVEAGTAAWYDIGAPARKVLPAWIVVPPAGAPDFQNVKIDDRSRRLLRFDRGLSARWIRPGAPDDECTLFFFRWEPGHASAAQAEMHQPHICLTASGLTQIADWGIQPLRLPDGITLPVRRYEFALNGRSI